jgi:hypothetical protein
MNASIAGFRRFTGVVGAIMCTVQTESWYAEPSC